MSRIPGRVASGGWGRRMAHPDRSTMIRPISRAERRGELAAAALLVDVEIAAADRGEPANEREARANFYAVAYNASGGDEAKVPRMLRSALADIREARR